MKSIFCIALMSLLIAVPTAARADKGKHKEKMQPAAKEVKAKAVDKKAGDPSWKAKKDQWQAEFKEQHKQDKAAWHGEKKAAKKDKKKDGKDDDGDDDDDDEGEDKAKE